MVTYQIDIYDILAVTDGGLDIILGLYPDAAESVHKPNRKFKIREEKTPSTSLYKKSDPKASGGYIYLVTDFGSNEHKGKNAINCYMEEYGLSFIDAINELASRHGIVGAERNTSVSFTFSKKPATSEQAEKQYHIEYKDSFTDAEIECIFSKNVLKHVGWYSGSDKKQKAYERIKRVCLKYNFHPIDHYTYIKNREELTFASNDTYPMFAWTEQTKKGPFTKVYQPYSADKSRRFFSIGERDKDFVHGMQQLKEEYIKREAEANDDNYENGDDEDDKAAKRKIKKIDKVILGSGGSDCMNMALMGYYVIWPNSETAELTKNLWFELVKMVDNVYQLQDIDDTGIAAAHKKAMEYLDLYTIELPAELKTFKDRRGGAGKDVRDYLNHFSTSQFDMLVRTALPYRFWDLTPKYRGKGSDREQIGYQYEFNNVQAYNFLSKNGFYRMETEARKNGYMFIKVDGNIVTEIDSNEVKNFVHNFLRSRLMDNDLRNSMYRTTQLSDSSLSNLPLIEIDFTDNDKSSQFYMYPNVTLEVTADGIKEYKPGSIKRFVWNDDVIEHHFRMETSPFTISIDNNTGLYDIQIHQKDCLFLNYLIQVSRVHWRTELEQRLIELPLDEREQYRIDNKFNIEGSLLNADEIMEQKQHLVNKIFSIGYLLHRYKNPDNAWCVFAMDNNISEDGGSYGGSGKSILYNVAMSKVLRKQFYIGGRNPKITENQFIYDGLTEHHRYIYIDDANEYLNFHFFFDAVTGKLKVNPKNTSPYTIQQDKVGKYTITSNYVLRNIDASVERRILYTVFSDYYHNKGETTDYNESRGPANDFGKNLFDEFTREEWNHFYNTMMECLKFYLTVDEKINPPMDNVNTRNLKAEMGADFEDWAAAYFSEDGSNVNKLIVRDEAYKNYVFKARSQWKAQRFTKAMRAYCKLNNYTLNPEEIYNSKGKRCIHKVPEREQMRDGTWRHTDRMVSKEMMYIQTVFNTPLNLKPIESSFDSGFPAPVAGTDSPKF